jgi:hypothetical protein
MIDAPLLQKRGKEFPVAKSVPLLQEPRPDGPHVLTDLLSVVMVILSAKETSVVLARARMNDRH